MYTLTPADEPVSSGAQQDCNSAVTSSPSAHQHQNTQTHRYSNSLSEQCIFQYFQFQGERVSTEC